MGQNVAHRIWRWSCGLGISVIWVRFLEVEEIFLLLPRPSGFVSHALCLGLSKRRFLPSSAGRQCCTKDTALSDRNKNVM